MWRVEGRGRKEEGRCVRGGTDVSCVGRGRGEEDSVVIYSLRCRPWCTVRNNVQ